MIQIENMNPRGNKAGDCVVRAIAKDGNMSWIEAYVGLCEMGVLTYYMPNDPKCYSKFIEDKLGMQKHSIKIEKGDGRPTGKSFAYTHPKGTYVLRMANHLTCCIDGVIYDSWNCTAKSIYSYWEK